MTVTMILIGLAVVLTLVLIALKLGPGMKGTSAEDAQLPKIHMSGVYSVLRDSPREELVALRPKMEEIREYLANQDCDAGGVPLRDSDRSALLRHWKAQMEFNLREIEAGDRNGYMFYYYDHPDRCPGCLGFITKGNIVTREEIYTYPEIIPPFHLGCNFVLSAHHGSESQLKETTIAGMAPLFDSDGLRPELPEWTCIVSLSAKAEVNK